MRALAETARRVPLVIDPVVDVEVGAVVTSIEELDTALPQTTFAQEPIPWPAAFLAGKAFIEYRRRGGTRRSPVADFFIGAHAAVAGYRLLTHDAARYRTCFPTLEPIAPFE